MRVVVPDYQLSLAIGKEGQNARLAARLTGCRIDIRSDAQADDEAASPSPGVGRAAAALGRAGPSSGGRPGSAPRPPGVRRRATVRGARNIRAPPRARVWGGRNVDPGAHLCGLPGARSGQRPAACRRPGRGPACPILGAGSPAGVPPCTPPRSACTQRSDAGPSPGHCASRRRRCPAGGRSAPGPRPRRLLGGSRVRERRDGRDAVRQTAVHSRIGTRPVRTSRAGRRRMSSAVKFPR